MPRHRLGTGIVAREGRASIREHERAYSEALRSCACATPRADRIYLGVPACRACGRLIARTV